MKDQTMQEPLKTFRSKFPHKPLAVILSIFVLLTVVLVIAGRMYYDYQKEKIENDRFEYLSSISDFKMSQIEDWINGRFTQLEVLRVNSPLVSELETIVNRPTNTPRLESWFESLKKYYQYDDIVLAELSEERLMPVFPAVSLLTDADSLLAANSIEQNKVLFSDSDEKYFEKESVKFFVPLNRPDAYPGISKKVLILSANPRMVFGKLLNRNIEKTSSLESLLVKSFGNGIIYLNGLKLHDESDTLESSRKALIEANTIKSFPGLIDGVDYKNDEVIAKIQPVPLAAWTLITKINKSELYSPVHNLARMVSLVVFSADLLFAFILFFIWRKSIVENYRKMYAAEAEKTRLENRFESLVNGVKDIAIFMLDRDGKIVSWNEGAEIIGGYKAKEILGKNISLLYLPQDAENNKPGDNLAKTEKLGNFSEEGWRRRKDGSQYWANVSITALKDEDDKIYGFLKIVRDLSEKRKNEEAIKRSRDFYLKLLDDFPTPIRRSGPDGKCDYFNKAYLNFTGKSQEEESGDGWTAGLYSEDKEKVVTNYYDAVNSRNNVVLEYRLRNSKDEYRWIVDFGMPYYDMDNNFAGYIGSCFDIDDRKKYEDTINALMRIGEKLYSSLEIKQITDSLVVESINIAGAEAGYACIKKNDKFVVERYFNEDHWEYFDHIMGHENELIKRFEGSKESIWSDESSGFMECDIDLVDKYSIKQVLATPLFGPNGELIGFFEIHKKKNNGDISKDTVQILKSVSRNASVAIAKSLAFEQLRRTEIQLRNSESELRNLAAQIQYGREEERQRIAREVHDELGQLFTGINLNISLLTELLEQEQKVSIKEILDELHSVQQFVNQGIQTVRDISGSLRSYVLDHLGLVPAVQEYCLQIERLSGLKCFFHSELESFNFNDERNVAVFRIIQEAITNVLRHAEASVINLSMKSADKNLEIIVSDDGKGIQQGRTGNLNSMGILGMKERAVFLGGKLSIDSAENEGTKVKLIVPFR